MIRIVLADIRQQNDKKIRWQKSIEDFSFWKKKILKVKTTWSFRLETKKFKAN